MCKRRLIRCLSIALSIFVANIGFAQEPQITEPEKVENEDSPSSISIDFTLPVTLDSKSQTIDGKRKTSIFTGAVVIRQGSLELLAERVEVDASGGAGKEVITATGAPASYKQRKDDGSMVEAKANEIVYQVAPRTISLRGDARIMQNEVSVTSDAIVFDMTKEQILASTDEDSEDSVRTVISPGAFQNEAEPPVNGQQNPQQEQDK